ncbi:hypothetical protein ACU686_15035 [Yinghuangia aomiensis]
MRANPVNRSRQRVMPSAAVSGEVKAITPAVNSGMFSVPARSTVVKASAIRSAGVPAKERAASASVVRSAQASVTS